MLVYGFPTKIEALRFEWMWQHPKESRRLREIARTMKRVGAERKLKAKIRIVHEVYIT